ncbi:MAG: ABC transporter permease [Acidobacteria bacterium]|nr:ABC transporter permease [Acidobacteriota bacterium]
MAREREAPLWRRYARLLGANPQADIDDELAFHLQSRIEELVAQGIPPQEARSRALLQFGDLNGIRNSGIQIAAKLQAARDRQKYWAALLQDLRFALRTLRRDRVFATVCVAILALGIAANTTVFSVVNAVLLRPLPFPDSSQLVWFTSGRAYKAQTRAAAGLSLATYTVDAFREFRAQARAFHGVTAFNPFYGNSEGTLTGAFEPRHVHGVMVAQNFFPTLGVRPLFGRNFLPEEAHSGGRPVVLLSYPFWQQQFGGEPSVLGRQLTIGGNSVTVIGILPASFDFGAVFAPGLTFEFFAPADLDRLFTWGNTLSIIGRLRPGLTVAHAQSEADVLFPAMNKAHPNWWGRYDSTLTGLKDHVSGKYRRPLLFLWCGTGLVLLIVCVNLSSLFLARSAARAREFALRAALGAGRGRLLRQLLAEGFLLSAAGALAGIGLSSLATLYLTHRASLALPLLSSASLDSSAILWTALIAALAALVFSLAPASRVSSPNLQSTLKDGGHGVCTGRSHARVRAALVTAQIALACILLTGAGLLLRSFLRLLDTDLGFQPDHASVLTIEIPDAGNRPRRTAYLQTILNEIRALPGVQSAGVADMLPLGRNRSWGIFPLGKTYPKDADASAVTRIVTPGYLQALGVRLTRGRDFTWNDDDARPGVVIINETAARLRWEGEDALGRLARVGRGNLQVVGIVADVREQSPESPARPEMYLPIMQNGPEGAELVIRSSLPPSALQSAVIAALRSRNPGQPASELRPLRTIVDLAVSPRRFFLLLTAAFAALALLLSALGIYGVTAYSVANRTQELGIRMALGASSASLLRSVLASALKVALAGIAMGAAGAWFTARSIEALLYNTEPTDLPTFAAIAVILGSVSLLAAAGPARRAARIDPVAALDGVSSRR